MNITFNDTVRVNSQRTIVSLLSGASYYFVPVTKFDNNLFYCVVKCNKQYNWFMEYLRKIQLKLGFLRKPESFETRLTLYYEDCEGYYHDEPLVFDRQEILAIIKDMPDKYIGEQIL